MNGNIITITNADNWLTVKAQDDTSKAPVLYIFTQL